MNDVFFNELSLMPYCTIEELHERMLQYADVLRYCGELGHTKIRYESEFSSIMVSKEQNLADYCYQNAHNPEMHSVVNLILITQHQPYIDPDSEQEDDFIVNDYVVEVGDSFVLGYGMTAAFLYDSFSVGFCSSESWAKYNYSIYKRIDDRLVSFGNVYCLSDSVCFEDDSFVNWYVGCHEVAYSKRNQEPTCHLSNDHHGKNILKSFSEKIMKEDFVVGIINSLPYDSKAVNFVEKMRDDGIINLRLIDTDLGLGIAVQTTGTNKIQTAYLASLLDKKYGKKSLK